MRGGSNSQSVEGDFIKFHLPSKRYNNLNSGVVNRGKMLHAAVHNLQSFDRTMDQVSK